MRDRSTDRYFRTLGLSPTASAAEVQGAFRSLARQLHPDVSRRPNPARFIEVVQAYRVLREKLAEEASPLRWGPCSRCGRHDDLFDPLGFGPTCADCLLGRAIRRRLLPGPRIVLVVAKHLAAIACYGLCIFLLFRGFQVDAAYLTAAALAASILGFFALAIDVIWFTHDR